MPVNATTGTTTGAKSELTAFSTVASATLPRGDPHEQR